MRDSKPNGSCTNYGYSGGTSFTNNIYFNGQLHGASGNFKQADPLFVHAPASPLDDADFHISSNSPAADFGASNDFMPATDKDGHPRTAPIAAGAYQAAETSGIALPTATTPASSARYNLSGQRVSSGYRGIVISDGKKYLAR